MIEVTISIIIIIIVIIIIIRMIDVTISIIIIIIVIIRMIDVTRRVGRAEGNSGDPALGNLVYLI